MKKLSLFALFWTLGFGLAGCSTSGEDGGAGGETPVENSAATGLQISGNLVVGSTLTAGGIVDSNGTANATFSYAWKANGVAISGATGASYVLTSNDVGKTISVEVSFTDDDGYAETLSYTTSGSVVAANSAATGLQISGNLVVGSTLTAGGIVDTNGTANATFSYAWKANGVAISGATGVSYTLTSSDAGKTISVEVSFTDNDGYAETLSSATTSVVKEVNQVATVSIPASTVFIKNTALDAATFDISDANGGGTSRTYIWSKGSSTVANTASYTPNTNDDISLNISYIDNGYNSESLNLNFAQQKLAANDASENRWGSTASNYVNGFRSYVMSLSSASYTDSNALADFVLSRYMALKAAWAVIDGGSCNSGSVTTTGDSSLFTNCAVTGSGVINGSLEVTQATSAISVTWKTSDLVFTADDGKQYSLDGQETATWTTTSGNALEIKADTAIATEMQTVSETTTVLVASGATSNYTNDGSIWTFSQSKSSNTWIRSGDKATFIKTVIAFDSAKPLFGAVSGGVNQDASSGKWSLDWNDQGIRFEVQSINEWVANVDLNEDGIYAEGSVSDKWDTTAN